MIDYGSLPILLRRTLVTLTAFRLRPCELLVHWRVKPLLEKEVVRFYTFLVNNLVQSPFLFGGLGFSYPFAVSTPALACLAQLTTELSSFFAAPDGKSFFRLGSFTQLYRFLK